MPEVRERLNQSMEIWREGGGGSWIRRDVYPASRLRSRQSQTAVPTTDKENIPPPGTRVRSRRSPLPHWYPRTPLRDVTVVVHALERIRRRKRLRAAAAARRRSPINPSSPSSSSSRSSSSSPVVAEMNASVHNTPGSQEVNLPLFHDASPPLVASPSSCFSASTPQRNSCLVAHPPKEDDPKTAEFEKKLDSTILELEKLFADKLNKAPSTSRDKMRVLRLMR